MKTKTYYVTSDDAEFESFAKAESHNYYRAEQALKKLLYAACPYLENGHKVVQDILLADMALSTFKYLHAVLEDALLEAEDYDHDTN